jgi:hypothetical protein
MGRLLSSVKGQIMGFVGAWLGLQGVRRLVDYLIQGLERVAQIQEQIYQKGLSLAEIGQALEVQTGTTGMQQHWVEQAIALQKAGALADPHVAQQMMVSMDIAFGGAGGIKSPQIMALAKQLAPTVGAAGLGPEEVGQAFKFAGTAGIAPTAEAYNEYFAKVLAGYRTSESQVFGQFLGGLQKGGTAYMAMGGTLDETISAYSAAIAVTANEALAANLIEQTARLSGGGYEKPRQAIEGTLGVKWPALSMDERMAALLQYARGIPEAERAQTMTEAGFPAELSSQVGKMITPKATKAIEATREAVADATSELVTRMVDSYLQTMLALQRQTDAGIAGRQARRAPQFADWQRRLDTAKAEFEDQGGIGGDRWIRDAIEPQVIAIEQLQREAQQLLGGLPEGPLRRRTEQFLGDVGRTLERARPPADAGDFIGGKRGLLRRYGWLFYPEDLATAAGYEYTDRLRTLHEAADGSGETGDAAGRRHRPFVQHHYDNSIHIYPRVGPAERRRFSQVGE